MHIKQGTFKCLLLLIELNNRQTAGACTWGHKLHKNPSSISKQWHVEVAAQISYLPKEGDVAQMQGHDLWGEIKVGSISIT